MEKHKDIILKNLLTIIYISLQKNEKIIKYHYNGLINYFDLNI